jgi:hypothetical protein
MVELAASIFSVRSTCTEFSPYYAVHCHYLAARIQDTFYREFSLDEQEDRAEGDGIAAYSKVVGAVGVMYRTSAVYCRAVVKDFLQLTNFRCTGRYSLCRSQFFVLLPRLWGDGQ